MLQGLGTALTAEGGAGRELREEDARKKDNQQKKVRAILLCCLVVRFENATASTLLHALPFDSHFFLCILAYYV